MKNGLAASSVSRRGFLNSLVLGLGSVSIDGKIIETTRSDDELVLASDRTVVAFRDGRRLSLEEFEKL